MLCVGKTGSPLIPKVLVGKPVNRGTRLAVEFIVDLLAQGWSEALIVENYMGIRNEDIRASRFLPV